MAKVRGVRRKFDSLEKRILLFTETFPEPDYEYGYWHLHLPTSQAFIDSPKTPVSVRKKCIQLLIDRARFLIDNKPNIDITTRVIIAISLPNLWSSQIIVFFGEEYYRKFFDRNSEYQKWLSLPQKRNIEKEWGLNILEFMKVKGYRQEIIDEDDMYVNELWFIGELD
ncbi:DUF3916 domain-containing protein [Oceanirhabdus sp. W0125-5]|uniref:DUF3916 domain-containing protein n=1 Tax=Oceanirhabdus sp. W0125-5 TaxID=2999116 RepID=UPI0022F2ACB5|nr:DUF3916 domain-containing protein [Oceanirhabdus sp. W0125-5]WBW99490.1 DUF3916 domain-containing protein [Oceanirhabdus sp. W0125-5]